MEVKKKKKTLKELIYHNWFEFKVYAFELNRVLLYYIKVLIEVFLNCYW